MPRPPSEITGSSIQIAVRVTASLRDEFKNLGGANWLRKLLAQSINKKLNNETVNSTTANPQTSDKWS
jgi:hypothetical protein